MRKFVQVFFALSIIFPILFLLVLSLGHHWSYPHVFPEQLSLKNWGNIFSSDSSLLLVFIKSFFLSVCVAFISTITAFITSKHIAYSKNKSRLLLCAYIPYVLSPVILAATLQYYFIYFNLSGSMAGVILAQFFIAYPFGVIILVSFWNKKLKAMEDLAATLGSSQWQTFFKVLLPVSKNALLLCFFQTFLVSWFEFGLTNLIGVGSVQTMTLKVYSFVIEANIFYAALASCLLIAPPMLLIWINKKYIFISNTSAVS